jgi:hypothetical protein
MALSEGLELHHLLIDDIGGRLGDLIAKAATQCGADLIVVGTHGPSRPSRLPPPGHRERRTRVCSPPRTLLRTVITTDAEVSR